MNAVRSDGPLVIAVDTSTTATKAIVVDPSGAVLALGTSEIPLYTPAMNFYEHDPRDWWRTTNEAVGSAVAELTPQEKERVSAMCVTPQRQSFGLFSADGTPIRRGPLWLDGRAVEQVQRYGSEDVHRLSGMLPDVTPSLYKMAWLKEHEPENLTAADKVVGVHGYVVFCLTGRWLDSTATADSLGLFDMARMEFSDTLLDIAGVTIDQMAGLVGPGEIIADIRPEIAAGWGLPGTIPLVAGCGDGQAAGLGAAAVGPDEAYLNMGTAIVAGVHSPTYRHGMVYRTDAAGLPGHYVLEVVQNSGAYLAGWFRENLGDPALGGRPDPALEKAAEEAGIGAGGLVTLPYWNAVQSPFWDPVARGGIVGFGGGHGRGHVYRSILEGLCLETARNVRGMEADTGTPITTVRVMGGGQRSPLWRQMMTDAIGAPLTGCEEEEISALGAAVMAMSVTGAHGTIPDIATSARAMARFGDVSEPDMAAHERYAEIGEIQGELYARLRDLFPRLAAFSETNGS
ncbi:xylulokinase [Propionicicella superfundia]|uniref:xylulokinase n=1 Tax=Propionicicella superfundia TaxID=348582 RepID=UPI0004099365|nr:FGGY family carbohydrate kinase [Propionicicella superfundia]